MMTAISRNSPVIGVIIIVIGIILFVFRDALGSATGYFVRGHYVDKPTPGCLLIPIALAFIIGGTVLLIRYLMGG